MIVYKSQQRMKAYEEGKVSISVWWLEVLMMSLCQISFFSALFCLAPTMHKTIVLLFKVRNRIIRFPAFFSPQ